MIVDIPALAPFKGDEPITVTGVPYLYNPINHLVEFKAWAKEVGGTVHLSLETFKLHVKLGHRSVEFYPQLVAMSKNDSLTAFELTKDFTFIGWNAQGDDHIWKMSIDKIFFKVLAGKLGLRIPAAWNSGEVLVDHFIIKPRVGTYSEGIWGPFEAQGYDFSKPLEDGAYYEQFIPGISLKSWVWNGQVIACEKFDPIYLEGDGIRTIREIFESPKGNIEQARKLNRFDAILAWQKMSPESVLNKGQRVYLEYRHNDLDFHRPSMLDPDVLSELEPTVQHQLAKAAAVLFTQIPVEQRHRALFSLDAVLDEKNRVWFLELNSHPGIIHPKVYGPMLNSFFDYLQKEDVLNLMRVTNE
jgi:hypothetical protein